MVLCLSWSPVSAVFGGGRAVWGEQEPPQKALAGLECVCDSELKAFLYLGREEGSEAPSCAPGQQIGVGSQDSSWQQAEAQGSCVRAWKINVCFISQVGL